MRTLRGSPAAWLAVALLPALSGCGAAATMGSTLYSTTEAIATAVKDAIEEPNGAPVEEDGEGPDRGER